MAGECRLNRYFPDDPNRKASLTNATAWRDEMLATLPPPRKFKRRYVLNKTGVIGVTYRVNVTRAGTHVPQYAASWTDDRGASHRRVFSVRKYGAAKARRLATRTRQEAIAEMLRPNHVRGRQR
jgi:hypothetical protein